MTPEPSALATCDLQSHESPLLSARGLSKRYSVKVLDNARLDVNAGEIHTLLGANGAGKSTLCKIIAGLVPASGGSMSLGGQTYRPKNKADAERGGVQIVQQELNLVETLSVAENLFFGRLPTCAGFVAKRKLHASARKLLKRFGLSQIPTTIPVSELGIGNQQMIEIAAALDRDCRVLILDEPTAALSFRETEALFEWLGQLRDQGVGMIYISHRLDEIKRIADRATVLRDGKTVDTFAVRDVNTADMITAMTGNEHRPIAEDTFRSHASNEIALRVNNLSTAATCAHAVSVDEVSLCVHRGERLGIAGLVGSGRSELLRAIFGADSASGGTIDLAGGDSPRRFRHPAQATKAGLAMVTEDRKQNGLLLNQPILTNTTLVALWDRFRRFAGLGVRSQQERSVTRQMIQSLETRCESMDQIARTLSGGNQQKVVVAKWLVADAEVFLFDEPTRGIDVAARNRIHRLFDSLAADQKSMIIVSSDLDELLQVCDRILVMSAGQLCGEFHRENWNADAINQSAFSGYQ